MKSEVHEQLAHWEDALRALLDRVPVVHVDQVEREPAATLLGRPDGRVDLTIDGEPWQLTIEVKTSGEPRVARAAAATLNGQVAGRPRQYGVLVVPFLSEAAREIVRAQGVGWLDLAGNALLSFANVYMEVSATARNPFTSKRAQRSIFAPKSRRLLKLLLLEPGPWKVQELADRAEVSLGQVSNVRQALLDREWAVAATGGGIKISQPEALLDAWRDEDSPSFRAREGWYTLLHGQALEGALRELFEAPVDMRGQVLLASHSVARRIAPYARVSGEYFYADAKGQKFLKERLRLTPATRGENIVVMQPQDDGIWVDPIDLGNGLLGADLIQTYVDLSNAGDRGQEAAAHLRTETLEPRFEEFK